MDVGKHTHASLLLRREGRIGQGAFAYVPIADHTCASYRRAVIDSPENRAAIGARIAHARLAAGYENAAAFAKRVGVTPNTLYRWESGKIVPDIWSLAAIAEVAEVSADWLLFARERPHAEELAAWRATARGQLASPPALAFMASVPLKGYRPTDTFFDLLLFAYEQGLDASDAVLGARYTDAKRR